MTSNALPSRATPSAQSTDASAPSSDIHVTNGDPTHCDEGTDPLVVVLKSDDFGRAQGPHGELPYRIDLLRSCGVRLGWTDAHLRSRMGSRVRRLEAVTVPFEQAWRTRSMRQDATATIAVFESEGHGLALWRRVTRRRRTSLVLVSCWLADLARRGGARRRLYQWLYARGAVDAVTVFSANQVATLSSLLGIDPARIHVVRFGVDLDALTGLAVTDEGRVVAAGRDLGRDWPTLLAAAAGSGWQVDLLTRPRQVDGMELPAEVQLRGRVPHTEYLDRLARASVVVVPTEVREYPTGQTVLLEAMALGKACVVTDTPAMREYVEDEVTGLLVPPHDPVELRGAVDRLLEDPSLRHRLGDTARRRELRHGGARAMWASIAAIADASAAQDR